jgi:hypothetical protein
MNISEMGHQLDAKLADKGIAKTDRLAILLVFRQFLRAEQEGNTELSKTLRTKCKLMILKAGAKAPLKNPTDQ